ncbi:hypothetical protein FWH13_01495 [Candidatus Saccharibacteria bacterium]|nr:hypothetical protein [Candidatus Saccharibacteria bacterium]
MKVRIEAKVKDYTGISACVAFANGVAEAGITENQLAYFKRAGYRLTILGNSGKGGKPAVGKGKDSKPADTDSGKTGGDAGEGDSVGGEPEA